MGGAGSAVLESLASAGINIPMLQLGLPDTLSIRAIPLKCWLIAGWTKQASSGRSKQGSISSQVNSTFAASGINACQALLHFQITA